MRLSCRTTPHRQSRLAGSAGDVNGDGYADLAIGAPDYDAAYADEGAAFVYFWRTLYLSLVLNRHGP